MKPLIHEGVMIHHAGNWTGKIPLATSQDGLGKHPCPHRGMCYRVSSNSSQLHSSLSKK